jgi:hypothetical protein
LGLTPISVHKSIKIITIQNLHQVGQYNYCLCLQAKVYAYLTIACNLLYNNSNFLKSKDDYDSESDLDFVKGWMDGIFTECICSKDPNVNSEWIDNMFNFLILNNS